MPTFAATNGRSRTVRFARKRRQRDPHDGDLAIDLGTGTVRIANRKRLLVAVPAAVAHDRAGSIVATGWAARELLGRTAASMHTVEPVVDAAVARIDEAERLLAQVLDEVGYPRRRARTQVLVATPIGGSALERRALRSCVQGVLPRGRVVLLEAPIAAAVGEQLQIEQAAGSMIVDIGRGRTEAAVVSLGEIVAARSEPIGGQRAELAVGAHLSTRYDIVVGRQRLEELVVLLSTPTSGSLIAKGTQASDGRPTAVPVPRDELLAVVDGVVDSIAEIVRSTLDATPVALAADVMVRGIHLTGGSSQLAGLTERVRQLTRIDVHVSPVPGYSVIDGTRQCLTHARRAGALSGGWDRADPGMISGSG